jgi:hypothetical protein
VYASPVSPSKVEPTEELTAAIAVEKLLGRATGFQLLYPDQGPEKDDVNRLVVLPARSSPSDGTVQVTTFRATDNYSSVPSQTQCIRSSVPRPPHPTGTQPVKPHPFRLIGEIGADRVDGDVGNEGPRIRENFGFLARSFERSLNRADLKRVVAGCGEVVQIPDTRAIPAPRPGVYGDCT